MTDGLNTLETKQLQTLVEIVSPTTDESAMTAYLADELTRLGAAVACDHIGNLTARFERSAKRTVALSAHADTIAVQVTNILPNGYLQFRPIGPLPHTLLGQRLTLLNFEGKHVPGVMGFDPTSQYGQPKGLVFDDLWIDIGAPSKAEAAKLVRVGDMAVFTPQFFELADGQIAGTALDNRAGLFVVLEAARLLQNSPQAPNLEIIFTAQEEVGLRGAQIAAKSSEAEICFVVDVEYATDTLTPHSNQLSEVRLGAGPVVLHKADNNHLWQNRLVDFAESAQIEIQHAVGRYPYGGTDATQLQVACGGIPVVNLALPCRYMHSPVEVCNKSDLNRAAELLAGFIAGIV